MLLPTLVEAASYSERGNELPPYYETYFAAIPQSKLSLGELAEIGRGELDQSVLGHQTCHSGHCRAKDRRVGVRVVRLVPQAAAAE